MLNGRRAALREAAENVSPRRQTELAFECEGWGGLPDPVAPVHRPRAERERQAATRARRRTRYEEAHRLRKQGASISSIARTLGMHRETVRIFLAADTYPERAPFKRRASTLRGFGPYLAKRWSQGCHNASKLHRELRDQGYTGSRTQVCNYVKTWRKNVTPLMRRLAELPDFTAPSPKQTAWLLLKPESATTTEEREFSKELLRISPEISDAFDIVREFRQILSKRDAGAFDQWLGKAKAGTSRELRSFAQGLEEEGAAVRAALDHEWSTGQVEGQIHRLKLLKRQMYGRAKLDLLKRRLLHAA